MHTAIKEPPPLARRLALLASLLVVMGLGGLLAVRLSGATAEQAALAQERDASAAAAGQAPSVEVTTPEPAELPMMVVLTGQLEPSQSADLSFPVSGRISRVEVHLGEAVHAGDTLVTLDRSTIGAAALQTTAAIDVAQANVDMIRDRVALLEQLTASGASPGRDLTQAQQQLAVAEAQLAQATAGRRTIATSSADHSLHAPFDGVMTRVPDGVGAVVGPGLSIARVEDLSSLRLHTTVSEEELAALTEGATAVLEASGTTGTVVSIVRSLDTTTRRAPVEVLLPNTDGRLVAHSIVRAHVAVGSPMPALRIPATARRPNGTVLLVDATDHVVSRAVEARGDLEGNWYVTSGLSATDRVVVRPAATHEGSVVAPTLVPAPPMAASR
jgi:RND family efflux transporter MFP subunit